METDPFISQFEQAEVTALADLPAELAGIAKGDSARNAAIAAAQEADHGRVGRGRA